jgi:TPR repeat protein
MSSSTERDKQLKRAAGLVTEGKYEAAAQIYRSLASGECLTAQLMLGWMLETGRGVGQDLASARSWYKMVADAGSPEGLFYLGALELRHHRYQEALESLEMAASQHYMPALYLLGLMFDVGDGVSVDHQKAYRFYEQAAAMGHLFAERAIAVGMIKGRQGLMQRPKGIYLLAKAISTAFLLGLRDPESDRLRGSHDLRLIIELCINNRHRDHKKAGNSEPVMNLR